MKNNTPHPDDETDDPISYQVQYLQEGAADFYIMTCRAPGEPFHSEIERAMHELRDMSEAVEIAEALVRGYTHPHKRTDRGWRPILDARVITIVRLSKVTAVYSARTDDGKIEESGTT